jgi:hypothetical protein
MKKHTDWNNKQVVLTAVNQDGWALQLASKELQADPLLYIYSLLNRELDYIDDSITEKLKNKVVSYVENSMKKYKISI